MDSFKRLDDVSQLNTQTLPHFVKLREYIQNEDWPAVQTLSEQILSQSIDPLAFYCKVYSLVKQNLWKEAIELFEAFPMKKKFHFLYIYCLYRASQYKEAIATITKLNADTRKFMKQEASEISENDKNLMYLEAQVDYALRHYDKSEKLYLKLLAQEKDNKLIFVNYLASVIALGSSSDSNFLESAIQMHEKNLSYEIAFNLSCLAFQKGDVPQAVEYIETAKECYLKEFGNTDRTMLWFDLDYLHIQAQLALAYDKDTDQAQETLRCILRNIRKKPSTEAIHALCISNLPEFSPGSDTFYTGQYTLPQLLQSQSSAIGYNECTHYLRKKQLDKCRELRNKLKNMGLLDSADAISIDSALQFLSGNATGIHYKALASQPEIFRHETMGLLNYSQSHFGVAAEHFHTIIESGNAKIEHLALAYYMSFKMNNTIVAAKTLEETIRSMMQNTPFCTPQIFQSLLLTASICETSNLKESSYELYKYLLDRCQTKQLQLQCLGGCLRTYSRANQNEKLWMVEKTNELLPCTSMLDTKDILQMPLPFSLAQIGGSHAAENEQKLHIKSRKRKARKRKPKLSREFNPNYVASVLDPERWLPKHQRIQYKKMMARRKRKDNKLQRGGAQGDASASTATSSSSIPTAVLKGDAKKIISNKKKRR